MSRIGIIGTGSMGSMLARKFIEAETVLPAYITAYNHTPDKLEALVKNTGIRSAASIIDIGKYSEIIFVCVRPHEVKKVLMEIRPYLTDEKIIVSIASDVSIKNLSEWSGINVTRVIPSITAECMRGISSIVYGDNVPESFKNEIFLLFSSISKPFVTKEENLQLLSDITSSSPAIIASIMQEFAMAAVRRGGISKDEAEFLVKETLIGTSKLFSQKENDFETLISSVSTKGGITAEGVEVVREKAPLLFDNIISKMSDRHKKIIEMIDLMNGKK